MADPPFEAGFVLWVSLSRASRKRDARAGHSAHSASLHHYPAQSNRAGYPPVRKAILRLVLQPELGRSSSFPMALSGSLLMLAAPARPGAGGLEVNRPGPDQVP